MKFRKIDLFYIFLFLVGIGSYLLAIFEPTTQDFYDIKIIETIIAGISIAILIIAIITNNILAFLRKSKS